MALRYAIAKKLFPILHETVKTEGVSLHFLWHCAIMRTSPQGEKQSPKNRNKPFAIR